MDPIVNLDQSRFLGMCLSFAGLGIGFGLGLG